MIIWQRCWINKEYNEVKLKKISFNLPLSWWGYKRPWRTEDPRSKTPQWILWSSWSSKHGASRERTHPRAAAETSSRSAEGNLLIRTKIIVKGSYRQKVCTSHPAVLSLFTSRSWWLASLKVRGGDLNIHLNPKQTAPTKQPVQKVKELMEDMGLIGAPYSTLIIYQNRPTQGQIKSYRVGRGNSRPERMRPDKYCSRLKRNNVET